jgi:hypothetical protein
MKDNLDHLGIHLKVRDIGVSRTFYETLGFVPVFGYGDQDFRDSLGEIPTAPERYRGVTYAVGKAEAPFEIAEGHIAVKDQGVFAEALTSPKVSAMLRVKSLVPILEGTTLRPTFPVRKYYWGTIEMVLRDPDGWVLVLIAPYSEGEFQSVQRHLPIEVIEAG